MVTHPAGGTVIAVEVVVGAAVVVVGSVVRGDESGAFCAARGAFKTAADWPAQANATTPSASPPTNTTTTRKGEDTPKG
jgi:hypothetical protein